jgi:hypothetical protein
MSRATLLIILIVFLAGCHSRPQPTRLGAARITVAKYHWVPSVFVDTQSMVSYYHATRPNCDLGFIHLATIDSNGNGMIGNLSRDTGSLIPFHFTLPESSEVIFQYIEARIVDTSYFAKESADDAFPLCMLIERKDGTHTLISYNPAALPPFLWSIHRLLTSIKGDSSRTCIAPDQLQYLASLIAERDEPNMLTWVSGVPVPVPRGRSGLEQQ